tara:strand:+ start:124 stop:759 length:636 start_codon:yes stop_codon:yes gene_type:complete
MANLFDSANYPNREPEVIIAGDFISWKRDDFVSDYDPASYALSYSARKDGAGSTSIAITASESSTSYFVEVGSSTTAAYTIGDYRWQAYITRSSDSERVLVDEGIWEVVSNYASASDDPASFAKTMVDNLETTLKDLSTRMTSSYSIADRSNTLARMEDVRNQLVFYRAEYKREIMKQRAINGQPTGNNVLVRFGRLRGETALNYSGDIYK